MSFSEHTGICPPQMRPRVCHQPQTAFVPIPLTSPAVATPHSLPGSLRFPAARSPFLSGSHHAVWPWLFCCWVTFHPDIPSLCVIVSTQRTFGSFPVWVTSDEADGSTCIQVSCECHLLRPTRGPGRLGRLVAGPCVSAWTAGSSQAAALGLSHVVEECSSCPSAHDAGICVAPSV